MSNFAHPQCSASYHAPTKSPAPAPSCLETASAADLAASATPPTSSPETGAGASTSLL